MVYVESMPDLSKYGPPGGFGDILNRHRRSVPSYDPEDDYGDDDDDDEDDYDKDYAGDDDYPVEPFFGKFPRGLRVIWHVFCTKFNI